MVKLVWDSLSQPYRVNSSPLRPAPAGIRTLTKRQPASARRPIPIGSGIWESDPADPALADFVRWDHQLYMFRIRKDDGSVVYRTDLYSRCQIGSGREKPENPRAGEAPWNHTRQDTASKRRIASIECDCADSASPRESGRMQFSGATTSGRSANDHYNRRRLEGANGRAERTTQSCWLRPGDLISTGGSYGVRCVICQTVPSGSSI